MKHLLRPEHVPHDVKQLVGLRGHPMFSTCLNKQLVKCAHVLLAIRDPDRYTSALATVYVLTHRLDRNMAPQLSRACLQRNDRGDKWFECGEAVEGFSWFDAGALYVQVATAQVGRHAHRSRQQGVDGFRGRADG